MKKPDKCREFLESYRGLMLEATRLGLSARSLWEAATGVTSHLSGMPRSNGDSEAVKVALAQATKDTDRRLAEALRKREEIEVFLDGITNDVYRNLLKMRYVDLHHWPVIVEAFEASGIPYCDRSIFNLHGYALDAAREHWKTLHPDDTED